MGTRSWRLTPRLCDGKSEIDDLGGLLIREPGFYEVWAMVTGQLWDVAFCQHKAAVVS
jgi:hypothetical protein